MALEFKRNKLNVKDGSGDFVEIPVLGEQKTEKATVGELAIEVSRATAAEEAIAARVDKLQKVVGSPFVAATAASMTNTDRVYVYTGSETGYTAGNWYYYDGTAWVSGGVYNSAGVNVDDTLTYEGMAADAKATGDEFTNVKNAIDQKQDATNYVTLSGTIVTQTGADNTMYLCGELAELTFTAPATGITAIRFTSGTTPTVVTFSGVTWLNGFDPSAIEASKTYEVNILNGLGCAAWT